MLKYFKESQNICEENYDNIEEELLVYFMSVFLLFFRVIEI